MYGRDFTLAVDPSPRGVAAYRLFEAVGSSSQFATYADVEARLRQLGPGSSAVLASRWRGRGQSGHAFLAVNDGGQIYLVDPHSGERSGWPPPWSEDAVRRTAVGYLDADGVPVNRYDGAGRQLAAAGFIGRVQGLPGTSAAADAALAQRVPQLQAEELVNPVGSADLAVERARANAQWWAGLSDTQRRAPDRSLSATDRQCRGHSGNRPRHCESPCVAALSGSRRCSADEAGRVCASEPRRSRFPAAGEQDRRRAEQGRRRRPPCRRGRSANAGIRSRCVRRGRPRRDQLRRPLHRGHGVVAYRLSTDRQARHRRAPRA